MFRSFLIMFVLLITTTALSQNFNVKVNLIDGNLVEGKLLKISSEGVDINPGGAVKFRFISAERIKNVEILELNKTIEYPLKDPNVLQEIKGTQAEYGSEETFGFSNFVGIGMLGYSSVDGKYYEGFHSGLLFRVGMYYYFEESAPTDGRFLLGFTYNHSSISGDQIYGFDTKLLLNEYSFEFGRTTNMFGGSHYLYLLMGLVVVTNNGTVAIPNSGSGTTEMTYSETKAALRIEGDGSIHLGSKLSLLLSVGYDIVLGEKTTSGYYYSYNEPNFSFIGGILNLSAGLSLSF